MSIPCLVIVGPTASGKTAIAADIADMLFPAAILSADSRQVYRGMDIGTGKDMVEYQRPQRSIPTELINIADPREIFTLHHYQHACYDALKRQDKAGFLPILCGGTGLYIEAVLSNYLISSVPEDEAFRKAMAEKSTEELCEELRNASPELFARTDCSSKKRIIRSLEIAKHAPSSPLAYKNERAPILAPKIIAITWEREALRCRIDNRLDERLATGMIEEVSGLLAQGVSADRLELLGLEYRYIGRYCRGILSYDEMKETLRREIYRLAKRQMTWFRGMERRGFSIDWFSDGKYDDLPALIGDWHKTCKKSS